MGILSSYLLLFISFYFATYKRSGKGAAKRAVKKGEIAIDPKFSDNVVDSLKANGNGHAKPNGIANGHANGNGNGIASARSPGPVTRSRKA